LHKVELEDGTQRKLAGGETGAGGGGCFATTGEGGSLARALREVDRALDDFLTATCSIHGLQRTLAGPVKEFYGTGGLCKDDLLQFFFTAYNVQKQFEDEECACQSSEK
jgi:hypothetical protein